MSDVVPHAGLRRKRPLTQFVIVQMALLVIGLYLAEIRQGRAAMDVLAGGLCRFLAWFYGLFGIPAKAEGALVMFDGRPDGIGIVVECTGYYAILAYVCFVLAFPWGGRWKTVGITVGAVWLCLLNLLRLIAAGLLVIWYPPAFHFVHDILWQFGFMALTCGSAALWVHFLMRKGLTPAWKR